MATKFKSRSSESSGVSGGGAGIPKKASLVVYLITLVAAVFCRCQQLLTNVNFTTGRYIDDNIMKNTTLFVIIIGMALISFILLTGRAKDKVIKECIMINPWRLRYDRLNKKISPTAGYSCLLMCMLIFIDVVMTIAQTVSYNKEIRSGLPEEEAEEISLLAGLGAIDWIEFFIMFLVFLTFLSMAMNIFKKEGISRANCAALSCFAAWKVVEIFGMFADNTIIAVSSEKVYELLSSMVTTIFFINTSRFFMGLEKKHTRFWMCFNGYLASILSAVSVIPRYIMLITPTGYDERLDMGIPAISDIGMVFTTITIVAVFWSTYVYRVMPKMASTRKRWTMNARPKVLDMKTIDVDDVDTDII